jgi:hypothetical protein
VEDRPEYLSSSARGLSLSGLVLFGLYGSIVLGSVFPIQLMAPAWQLKVGSTLINASPFPLIGLGLLHLAADLSPDDELLSRRHDFAARLAVAVSLGFLLLVPLISMAAVTQQQQRATSQSSLIRRSETNLQALTQAVSSSQTTDELRDRLIALNGPVIDEANAAKPLPTIKAEVNNLLQRAAAQVSRKRQQLPPPKPWRLLPELLRNAFACLALAIGFAGLAFRSRSSIPLLAELQLGWERQKNLRMSSNRGARPGEADPDYLQELIKQAEAEDSPPTGPLR